MTHHPILKLLRLEETAPAARGLLLTEALRRFLAYLGAERRASKHTIVAYARDLRQLLAFAGEHDRRRVPEIDLTLLRAWLAGLDCSPATRARKIGSTRSFFRFLEREGELEHRDPARDLTSPKLPLRLPRFLDVEAAAGVVVAPGGPSARAARDRALLETLYGSGVRVSELCGLDLDDLDLDRRAARVIGKGDVERVVPLGRPCVAALRAYLRRRDELARRGKVTAALFLSRRGARLSVRQVQELVRHYGELAGRAGLHPHVLRHTCATHLLEGGCDVRVIQVILGHHSLASTQRYTHVTVQHLLEAYDAAHPLSRVAGDSELEHRVVTPRRRSPAPVRQPGRQERDEA